MHVAVVGSGPAGLIAAETLAQAGVDVTVVEQHRSPGRKFLLAGRSGLNLTHSEPLDKLLDRYGPDRPDLESSIRGFDGAALQEWCAGLGEPIVIGSSGRVFPESFRATPLLRSWLARLDALGVRFRFGHRWTGWNDDGALTFGKHEPLRFDAVILAVGGASWPRVGGDGSWQPVLRSNGIDVEPLTAANSGVLVGWTPSMLDRHEGEPIKNVAVRAGGDQGTDWTRGGIEPDWTRGDIVVTRAGLEGGPVYAVSRSLRQAEPPVLSVDLAPDLAEAALADRLRRRRKGATQTAWLKGAGLSPVAISLVRDATGNSIPDDPAATAALLKSVPVRIDSLAAIDRAISSAGGVRFDQVDDNFMLTGRPGTFVAGEMLDWEAPTGGYLLQGCFSTGVAAANGVIAWLG